MNEEDFKSRVRERWGARHRHGRWGRVSTGIFFLIIGSLLLARAGGVAFPSWFFSAPVLLMGIGLSLGIRHRFRNFFWLIPFGIGGLLLVDKLSPDITLRPYIWPMVFIGVGLVFIFRPKGRHFHRGFDQDDNAITLHEESKVENETTPGNTTNWQQTMTDGNDVVDITAVFGGIKKNILSKSFKGGDVTAFMGGAELNMMQADFKGRVTIDSFNMFGGTKLIVPPDWDVQSGIVAIFGGVDDKRPPSTAVAPDKVLYLDGTCIFGGVEIKSY